MKFFINSNTTAYLRSLEEEFGESSNSIRLELNRLEQAGMLNATLKGNKKFFQANTKHPLFKEIHSILLKHIGFDRIVENVIEGLGDLEQVFLSGSLSQGMDSQIIDLIFIGDIDRNYLVTLVEKAEKVIKRKIRFLVYADKETAYADFNYFKPQPLLLWSKD